jgi:hypothetical protein
MRNTMCCTLILSLGAIALAESKTEVVVQRGTVKTQTAQGERVVNAGQKSVLAEGQKPLVAVNDPLVQEVIQMYRWVEEEKRAGLRPVETVHVAVQSLDESNLWRYSSLNEWTNQTSEKLDVITIGPMTTLDNLKVYDLDGNELTYETISDGINVSRYTLHFPRPIEPNRKGGFILSSKNYNRAYWASKGPVWTINFASGPQQIFLQYTKIILPKSAILLSAYPNYVTIDKVEDRIALTFRDYKQGQLAVMQQVSFLWPDQDGATMQDVPLELRGLADPDQLRLAQAYSDGVASILAGKRVNDASTPMNSALSAISFIVHDLDKLDTLGNSVPFIKALFGNDMTAAKIGLTQAREGLHMVEFHSGGVIPADSKNGTIVPIVLKLKGTVTPYMVVEFTKEGEQWFLTNSTSDLGQGIPGRTKLTKIKPDLAQVTYKGLQPGQFMTRWLVLGPVRIPFKNEGFFPNEEARKIDFEAQVLDPGQFQPTVRIGDQDYEWSLVTSESDKINLTPWFKNWFVTAYAWAQIEMEQDTPVVLGISSNDNNRDKVWLNGRLGFQSGDDPQGNHRVPVTFKKGTNQLVLMMQHGGGPLEFSCRALITP